MYFFSHKCADVEPLIIGTRLSTRGQPTAIKMDYYPCSTNDYSAFMFSPIPYIIDNSDIYVKRINTTINTGDRLLLSSVGDMLGRGIG